MNLIRFNLVLFALTAVFSCEERNNDQESLTFTLPELVTISPATVTQTTAILTGSLISTGDTNIIEKGFYWGTEPNTINSGVKIQDDSQNKYFSILIEDLIDETKYYVNAYAINSIGISYGGELSFITDSYKLSKVVMEKSDNYTFQSIPINAEITDNGGAEIIEKGFYWGLNPNSELTGTKHQIELNEGIFSDTLFDLIPNNTYYIRAYAINSVGITISNEISYILNLNISGPMLEDIDGNIYKTVYIGEQLWMAEDLKVTKYRDGSTIPLIIYDDSTGWPSILTDMRLSEMHYNHKVIQNSKNICPIGWHIPSNNEWRRLIDFIGGKESGGKLKEVGTLNWREPNSGASNESGFTALPRGIYSIDVENGMNRMNINGSSQYAFYWSSDYELETGLLSYWYLTYDNHQITEKSLVVSNANSQGFIIRCVAD
jgi:uncharacterized protein (TIGR02145 family)